MTTSITGALLWYAFPDHPSWAPHRTVTNREALNALTKHMARDAIRTGTILHSESGRVSGNFWIASAGFCIENLTDAEWFEAVTLWKRHVQTRHYRLARQLSDLHEQERVEVDQCLAAVGYNCRSDQTRADVRAIYWDRIKALEHQLQVIYDTNNPKKGNP